MKGITVARLSCIILCIACLSASADVNDLSQGVMIAHAPAVFTYSPGMDYCGEYPLTYAISSCGEQNNRVELPMSAADPALWYVVSAFEEAKQWAGIQFGFGDYAASGFYFVEYGPCLLDSQTIPTDGWPGPNQGVVVVATSTNWTGNFVATYYFIGYSYEAGTVVPLGVHPVAQRATHGTTVPPYPSISYDVVCLGAIGVDTDGSACCPAGGPEQERVCCMDDTCTILTEAECSQSGGTWYEYLIDCDPNPCPQEWACCYNQVCFMRYADDCDAIGGIWHEGFSCPGGDPPIYSCFSQGDVTACCLPDESCVETFEQDCLFMGGELHIEFDDCDPNPCGTSEIRACCYSSQGCQLVTEQDCLLSGGTWMPNEPLCDPDPCLRACCVNSDCVLLGEEDCDALGGHWYSAWPSCQPNPCPQTFIVNPDGSGDYPTIQDAINAASNWDIIELANGVFAGDGNRDLDHYGKTLTIRAQSVTPDSCVIDCIGLGRDPHRAFLFDDGEGPLTSVEGITIRNGATDPGLTSRGGGILVIESSPTIRRCVFHDNEATEGGAIACLGGAPHIRDCTLAANHAPAGGSSFYCDTAAVPHLERVILAFGTGAAAFGCNGETNALLECCNIFGHEAGDWVGSIAGQYGENGNFSEDPVFCSIDDRDFNLACDSGSLHGWCGPIGALLEGCSLYGFTSLVDVGNDQGGQLRLRWHRSCADYPSSPTPITFYSIYRRVDHGRVGDSGPRQEKAPRSGREYPPGEWEYIAMMPASCELTYTTIAPTLCDSTATGGICWSAFFLRAQTDNPGVYFDCAPDSGYSVDNLAPSPPANLRLEDDTQLVWDPSSDEDFDYWTVYGSAAEHLDSTAVVVGYTAEETFDLEPEYYAYYHVTGTDFAGNEGEAASVVGFSSVPAEEQQPFGFALFPIAPNPGRAGSSVALSFQLPHEEHVRLEVVDITGRILWTAIDARVRAGRRVVEWNLRDADSNPVPSGIYLCRFSAGHHRETRKFAVGR